jgi:SWI/SNF-related matrix-associated actin-dependent regulator 1 of chromatin subfamily A
LQKQVKRILKHCDSSSENLRKSLHIWAGNDSKSKTDTDKNCMDILKIKSSRESDGILANSDFDTLCNKLLLKPYQLVGVNWLKLLHQNQINGVLADDMGLGKTIQTIAFLAWLKSVSSRTKCHLIIVPASVLANWSNELKRFCPGFRVVTYHGPQKDRAAMQYSIKQLTEDGEIDVILSTYTLFERESAHDDRRFLLKLTIEYLILDEAHCLKNPNSSRYLQLTKIQSKRRLLLSGTPVQNDLSELLALLSFLMPKVFGKTDCDVLLEAFGWEKGCTVPIAGGVSINQLRHMLSPFVLRRRKHDVLDQLSDKVVIVEKLEMPHSQKQVYDHILFGYARRKEQIKQKAVQDAIQSRLIEGKISGKKKLIKNNGEKIEDNSIENNLIDNNIKLIKPILDSNQAMDLIRELSSSEAKHLFTALRKAANHPLLLRTKYVNQDDLKQIATISHLYGHFGSQCDESRVKEELDKFSDFDIHHICMEYSELNHLILQRDDLYISPKMLYLEDKLPKLIKDNHRILIFSQWTRVLDLLEVLLKHLELGYMRLDGSTPVTLRQGMIDKFSRENIPVFLLSTKAGGLGINLTAADTVIMHDLDFNPENDRQAEDRCHRIGQTRTVRVYKLVTNDTVDEDILEMGERKTKLSQAVLSNDVSDDKSGDKKDAELGVIQRILQKALKQT